jgi:hypothetical protein
MRHHLQNNPCKIYWQCGSSRREPAFCKLKFLSSNPSLTKKKREREKERNIVIRTKLFLCTFICVYICY